MTFRGLFFFYLDWTFLSSYLSYQLTLFFPLLVWVLVAELYLVGWMQSSLRRLFLPSADDRWDLFSMLFSVTGGRRIFSNLMFFGFIAFWDKLAERYFPMVTVPGPFWFRFLLAFLLTDFLAYWNHRWRHEVKWFWLVHEFHHSSSRLTVWTKFRVHALDYFITMPVLMILPNAFFGWDMLDWAFFVILVEIQGFVIHSRIDSDFGWFGRYLLVSPRFHHLHHEKSGTSNKNFGLWFVFWDHLFGTYEAPQVSLERMKPVMEPNPYLTASPVRAYLRPVWDFYCWPFRALRSVRLGNENSVAPVNEGPGTESPVRS